MPFDSVDFYTFYAIFSRKMQSVFMLPQKFEQ